MSHIVHKSQNKEIKRFMETLILDRRIISPESVTLGTDRSMTYECRQASAIMILYCSRQTSNKSITTG